jgi:hypothetical protein
MAVTYISIAGALAERGFNVAVAYGGQEGLLAIMKARFLDRFGLTVSPPEGAPAAVQL